MKKLCFLMILMLSLLMCAAAAAEVDVPFVPHVRNVQFQKLSEKLDAKCNYDFASGTWKIVINAKNMTEDDWADVVASGYNGSEVSLYNFECPQANYPSGATRAATMQMVNDTEENAWEYYLENLEGLKNYNSRGYPTGSIRLGYYDPDEGVFLPANVTEKMYCAVGFRWMDAADQEVLTEHFLYTVTFDELPSSIEVNLPQVPSGMITLDSQMTGVKADGMISYSQEKLETKTILKTLIAPPVAGAVPYKGVWPMSVDDAGNAILKTELYPGEYAYEDCHIIIWKNGNETTYQRVIEKITVGEALRWPEYVADLKAFTKGNFSYHPYGSTKGVTLDDDAFQDHAELRLKPDMDELIKDAAKGVDITQAGMKLSITPPDDAVYYRNFPSGNPSTIYGMNWVAQSYPLASGNEAFVAPVPVKGSDLGGRYYSYLTKKEIPLANGKTTTFYYCDGLRGEFAGLVDMYFWYNEKMERIGQNYVIYTMDDLPLIDPVPLLSKDGEKDKFKGTPFAVSLNSGVEFEEAVLQAVRHPSSKNSHYYDLKLKAADGSAVDLNGEEVELYLPFPEGHNENSVGKLNLTVAHYTADHQLIASDVYTLENGKLEITPYGLKLKVKSFSPYVVSWEDEPAVIPQTGDRFPMSMLIALMLVSLASLYLMKRKTA